MNPMKNNRWIKAQQAEKSFWIQESQTPQYIDISGETRSNSVTQELAYFDLGVVENHLSNAKCVVEVGCGPIGLIHFIRTPALRIGIDPLIFAMERAGYRDRRGVLRLESTGETIPLSSDKADLVICYNVLDHCESPDQVLAEIYRILRPGGILLLQLHTIRELAAKFGTILSWLDPPHPFHFSKSQVFHLAHAAGFDLEFDGSFKRIPRSFPVNELLSFDGLRHIGSNWITELITNLRLRKPAA